MSKRLIAALGVSLIACGVWAESPTRAEREEFVAGNAYFVLLHEFAHVIVHDFAVPILGNEEDAADTLAATTLILLDQQNPDLDYRYTKMLLMAADANRILWERGLELENIERVYWANHPLSAQRAARIACLVYGSDADTFAELPDFVNMPLFRADWCEAEYALAENARGWVKAQYGSSVDTPQVSYAVDYGTARTPAHETIASALQEERLLDQTAEFVAQHFLLPEELTLRTRACGVPDAYWDGDEREVVLCYELLEAFYNLSAEQKVQALERRLRGITSTVAE